MNVVQQVTPQSKPFAWSYSKIKNFETCGRRYAEVELRKSVKEQRSQELDRGDALHEAMYARVSSGTPLPPEFIYMEHWAEKLTRELHPLQIIQCEQKLSVDRNYKPTGFFDKATWFRTKIDYLRTMPSKRNPQVRIGHIVDYKTGRPKEDFTQLALNAFAVFAAHKLVMEIRSDFLWTEYNESSHENFSRDDMPGIIAELLPRVIRLKDAIEQDKFEPRPCGLCENYCPVEHCEYWGKKHAR